MHKAKTAAIVAGIIAALAIAALIASWGFIYVAKAQGVGKGFEAALRRTYEMGRPIPDGQYVIEGYRVEASHEVGPNRQITVKVRVLENRTGLKLAEATSSANAY